MSGREGEREPEGMTGREKEKERKKEKEREKERGRKREREKERERERKRKREREREKRREREREDLEKYRILKRVVERIMGETKRVLIKNAAQRLLNVKGSMKRM